MNIFDCSARELTLLSTVIADQIAEEYNSKQQEKIAAVLVSIAAILDIYIANEDVGSTDVNI